MKTNLKRQDFGVYAYDSNTLKYMNIESNSGIYVSKVVENTAAKMAGLKENDIILSIDSYKLTRMCELRQYVYTKKPKDKVILKILRDNREMELQAELKKK